MVIKLLYILNSENMCHPKIHFGPTSPNKLISPKFNYGPDALAFYQHIIGLVDFIKFHCVCNKLV